MAAAREWVRRGGWADGQRWHLRPVPPPARRPRSSTAACGSWFPSGDVVAIWGGEDGLPHTDRCAVCEVVDEALHVIDVSPTHVP